MGQGVGDHHEDVEEADVDHHRPEGDDVRHQEQKEEHDPIEWFSLKIQNKSWLEIGTEKLTRVHGWIRLVKLYYATSFTVLHWGLDIRTIPITRLPLTDSLSEQIYPNYNETTPHSDSETLHSYNETPFHSDYETPGPIILIYFSKYC